jgi:transposase
VEIITGVERRRRWRVEEKLRIVAECERPGACLAAVARQHDVSSGLLWNWRRQARRGLLGADLAPAFFPIQVTGEPVSRDPCPRSTLPAVPSCPCCGGKLAKLGETITETLESIPRTYKVIQTVREKFSCRSCETITQPPAPFHPIARGRAGPDLPATIVHGKFGEHQPLNRQSERFAREGIDLNVSTLADWVGACTSALMPLVVLIAAHVLAAERLHGDDTTVPVLARGKTVTGRLWVYVRDDLPFGGRAPPGAIFHYSPDRGGKHPCSHLKNYVGILQADAYAGFNDLYLQARKPGPITEAACWAHGRRKLFVLADVAKAPLAIEAVRRIDAIFGVEREINGLAAEQRIHPVSDAAEVLRRQRRPRRVSLASSMGGARAGAGQDDRRCARSHQRARRGDRRR